MIVGSIDDVHAEIRCLILALRRQNNGLTPEDRIRIEKILWAAKKMIGPDFVSREQFERLCVSGVNRDYRDRRAQ